MKKNFYFLLTGLFMAMVSLAQGPVVYLPLDNDFTDASGNGFNATDAGTVATAFVNDAERGMVAFFDSAAHASLPKVDPLRFGAGQDFSYACWMKIDRVHGDPAIFGNKDWGSGKNKGFVMYVKNADQPGSPNCGINFCDASIDPQGRDNRLYWTALQNGAPDVVDGTWHFFAASFNRTDTLRVWVDGVAQYSPVAMSLAPGLAYDDVKDYPFMIMEDGTGAYNTGSSIRGYIDELRVWNRSITDADIQKIYSPITRVNDLAALSLNTTLYPNPSNGLVNVVFDVKKLGVVQLMIYNNTGAMVKGINHFATAGQNKVNFDVNSWVPGIYFVRIVTGSTSEALRLVVTK